MKTMTYQVLMHDGTKKDVEGVVVNGIYGIDKRESTKTTYNANGEERVSVTKDYFLTHIPSGLLVTNARTRKTLMEIANLEALTDETDIYKIAEAVVEYWNKKWWKD